MTDAYAQPPHNNQKNKQTNRPTPTPPPATGTPTLPPQASPPPTPAYHLSTIAPAAALPCIRGGTRSPRAGGWRQGMRWAVVCAFLSLFVYICMCIYVYIVLMWRGQSMFMPPSLSLNQPKSRLTRTRLIDLPIPTHEQGSTTPTRCCGLRWREHAS